MKMISTQEATARYYSRIGSRLGYLLVMKRSQHFGYYDHDHSTEDDAQRQYHEKFAKLLELQPGMAVLDAGCGQGVVACFLASAQDVHVKGITIVPSEVRSATRAAIKRNLSSQTEFMLGDYASTPFADGSFDRVYTTETLSHAPDVKQVLAELIRCLKPGGKAVFAEYEFNFKNAPEETKKAADFVKKHAAIHGIYQFGVGQFPQYLKELGLTHVAEQDWTTHIRPSFDRLRRLGKPVAQAVKGLGLSKYFVNTIASTMYADGVDQGVFKYKVYTAWKPR